MGGIFKASNRKTGKKINQKELLKGYLEELNEDGTVRVWYDAINGHIGGFGEKNPDSNNEHYRSVNVDRNNKPLDYRESSRTKALFTAIEELKTIKERNGYKK